MNLLRFDNDASFGKEVLAASAGAAAIGAIAPIVTSLPLIAAAPAGALLGGSIASALLFEKPVKKGFRALIGVAAGGLASVGYLALSTRFGLDMMGAVAGGCLGGMAMSTMLSHQTDRSYNQWSQILSTGLATVMGGVGILAAAKIAAYGAAENVPAVITSGTMAGLLGLWISTVSGVRRFRPFVNELDEKIKQLLANAPPAIRKTILEMNTAYKDILGTLQEPEQAWISERLDCESLSTQLMASFLDTAEQAIRFYHQKEKHEEEAVTQKLADLTLRINSCTDSVTLGHLTRASQALRAQKSSIEAVKIGFGRTEAALEAQEALLKRLRLALVQFQADEEGRFALEIEAVSDQVMSLGDDLESIQSAMAEAEAYSDRKLLADIEQAGRKALLLSSQNESHETVPTAVPNARYPKDADLDDLEEVPALQTASRHR
jgi:hypothetical protein